MKTRKSKLKTYKVIVAISHESFGGYDHNDGTEEHTVKASNSEVVGRKALKIAESDGGGYSYKVEEVQNVNDEDD